MLTYQAHFISELKKLLNEEIQRIGDTILMPNSAAIPDFSQYRYYIGMVQGLRRAVELCDEAEAIADGRDERG